MFDDMRSQDAPPISPWYGRARVYGRILVAAGTLLLLFGLPTYFVILVLAGFEIGFVEAVRIAFHPSLHLGQGFSALFVGGLLIESSFRRERRRRDSSRSH